MPRSWVNNPNLASRARQPADTTLGITLTETPEFPGRSGILTPYRYTYATKSAIQEQEVAKALSDYRSTFAASTKEARFLARAVFRGLQGTWTLSRTITSRISTFPSGTLVGTASLLPRTPTDQPSPPSTTPGQEGIKEAEAKADWEYLYVEDGEFRADGGGGPMRAKRSYVYRYFEAQDRIDLWFAKQDYLSADYFFHRLKFIVPEATTGGPWKAVASHLCKWPCPLLSSLLLSSPLLFSSRVRKAEA